MFKNRLVLLLLLKILFHILVNWVYKLMKSMVYINTHLSLSFNSFSTNKKGMSESCAATTFSTDDCHIWGSCGFAMPGCEVKIDHQDERG